MPNTPYTIAKKKVYIHNKNVDFLLSFSSLVSISFAECFSFPSIQFFFLRSAHNEQQHRRAVCAERASAQVHLLFPHRVRETSLFSLLIAATRVGLVLSAAPPENIYLVEEHIKCLSWLNDRRLGTVKDRRFWCVKYF